MLARKEVMWLSLGVHCSRKLPEDVMSQLSALQSLASTFTESRIFKRTSRWLLEVAHPWITGNTEEGEYRPSRLYRLLRPRVSGNVLNGLGETSSRRPFRILWTADDETPFGKLQRLFLILSGLKGTVRFDDHLYTRELSKREKRQTRQVPSPDSPTLSADELTLQTKRVALKQCDIVGICAMQEEWIFENTELPAWAYNSDGKLDARLVVVGVAMDYENFGQAPLLPAATEAMKQYDRGTESALQIGDFLLQQGYFAWGHSGPRAGRFLLVPAAEKAGLGSLGKHGSLISKEFGSSLRLGAVLTSAPLIVDTKIDFGSEDFCVNCQICVNECPVGALQNEKQWVRGEVKYYVDFDKCLPYFLDHNGCGICASRCPYSRPNVRPKLLSKHAKRLNKMIPVNDVSRCSNHD